MIEQKVVGRLICTPEACAKRNAQRAAEKERAELDALTKNDEPPKCKINAGAVICGQKLSTSGQCELCGATGRL